MSFMNKMKGVAGKGVVALGLAASAFTMAASPALADNNDKVFVMDVEPVGHRAGTNEKVCTFSVDSLSKKDFLSKASSGDLDGSYMVMRQMGEMIPIQGNSAENLANLATLPEHSPGVNDEVYKKILDTHGPTGKKEECGIYMKFSK